MKIFIKINTQESFYPAKINKIKSEAITKSFEIANQISLNGVLAIEMFILKNDQILINELAQDHITLTLVNGCVMKAI